MPHAELAPITARPGREALLALNETSKQRRGGLIQQHRQSSVNPLIR
jgi:hypothetical protein